MQPYWGDAGNRTLATGVTSPCATTTLAPTLVDEEGVEPPRSGRSPLYRRVPFLLGVSSEIKDGLRTRTEVHSDEPLIHWMRGWDLNPRPPRYERGKLPGCSTPRYSVGTRIFWRVLRIPVVPCRPSHRLVPINHRPNPCWLRPPAQ